MDDATSRSLLQRVRKPHDSEAWDRFAKLYTPLLFFWARREGLWGQDAEDLIQEVFTLLSVKLRQFEYDEKKTFRGWMRMVLLNKLADARRKKNPTPTDKDGQVFRNLLAPEAADLFWDVEYPQQLARKAMELVKPEFEPKSWKACWEVVFMGRTASDVAQELGLSLGAVYVAKSRVLKRLREELDGLLD